jgi:hypothetical protein
VGSEEKVLFSGKKHADPETDDLARSIDPVVLPKHDKPSAMGQASVQYWDKFHGHVSARHRGLVGEWLDHAALQRIELKVDLVHVKTRIREASDPIGVGELDCRAERTGPGVVGVGDEEGREEEVLFERLCRWLEPPAPAPKRSAAAYSLEPTCSIDVVEHR